MTLRAPSRARSSRDRGDCYSVWRNRQASKFGAAATDWLAKERPQQPGRPFPYREEEVTYLNSDVPADWTPTLPTDAAPPFPAVLLITGGGAQGRDETIFNHKPFPLIADQLTRGGIAVLRVDDRGVGASTGGSETLTSLDLAGDVEAGLAYLESRTDMDGRRLGLLGHSEAGLIASIAGSRSDDVAFLVLLAGAAVPGEEPFWHSTATGTPRCLRASTSIRSERHLPAGEIRTWTSRNCRG